MSYLGDIIQPNGKTILSSESLFLGVATISIIAFISFEILAMLIAYIHYFAKDFLQLDPFEK